MSMPRRIFRAPCSFCSRRRKSSRGWRVRKCSAIDDISSRVSDSSAALSHGNGGPGMIIDTHLHVIDKSVLDYPWLETVPPLNRDFSYETYAREARRVGIRATLHMEVDVAEQQMERETEFVGGLAARQDSLIVGAI